MKKFLGMLLVFVMVFALSTRVNAAKFTNCDNILTQTESYVKSQHNLTDAVFGGSNGSYTVTYQGETIPVTCNNNVIEFNAGTTNYQYATSVMQYLVGSIAYTTGETYITFDNFYSILDEIFPISLNKSEFCKSSIAGEMSSDGSNILKFKIDANNVGTNTCSSSGTSSNTTNKTTESNPKTGVFVPVVGISVLIVASVVCLLWISKKNIYKGF
ncbi:MAG: hypothetical protein IKR57_04625 [Bacilli bacterium]|nr:hypothetical protein [Bacilli bacterium]